MPSDTPPDYVCAICALKYGRYAPKNCPEHTTKEQDEYMAERKNRIYLSDVAKKAIIQTDEYKKRAKNLEKICAKRS